VLTSQVVSRFVAVDLPEETVTARYVYRSEIASARRRRVSWYLVARLEGSNVVARIEPLGLVPTTTRSASSTPRRDGRWLAVGPWQQTRSRHHSRVQVAAKAAS
jgi:hypothetical protein